MSGTTHSANRHSEGDKGPIRKGILITSILLGIVLVGGLLAIKSWTGKETASSNERQNVVTAPELKTDAAHNAGIAAENNSARTSPKALPIAQAATQTPRSARQVMAELVELSESRGPITKEQAERFKQNLDELIRQGSTSVPAIREFLQKNVDTDFAQIAGADELGYSSFRAALFDTLKQIGGLESQTAMVEALQTTAVPAELLELSKDLDQTAPGLYRAQILKAAHQVLDMASAHQLGGDVELGPAYRMLQSYGEANTTADLARHDPASFYNAIAMANLPDGQGLPSLIQMASHDASGSSPDASGQTIAIQMIAQLAGQNSQAVEALVQMAQKGQIRNSVLEKLAPILGGEQYQLGDSAGQNTPADEGADSPKYSILNPASTPDQINQRIGLIDKFLGLVAADSAAAAALKNQRSILSGKLGN